MPACLTFSLFRLVQFAMSKPLTPMLQKGKPTFLNLFSLSSQPFILTAFLQVKIVLSVEILNWSWNPVNTSIWLENICIIAHNVTMLLYAERHWLAGLWVQSTKCCACVRLCKHHRVQLAGAIYTAANWAMIVFDSLLPCYAVEVIITYPCNFAVPWCYVCDGSKGSEIYQMLSLFICL